MKLLEEMRRGSRVAIFVDNISLFGGVQDMQEVFGTRRIDYIKLRDYLANGRTVLSSRFYYSEPFVRDDSDSTLIQAAKKRRAFYYVLERNGYLTIRLPDYKFSSIVSLEIVYDICSLSRDGLFDTFILVAGEEDYTRVVKRVQEERGLAVEVAYFDKICSQKLKGAATKFIDLEKGLELFREFQDEREEHDHPKRIVKSCNS
jgi:uncharacterized LabA/DUF88 family protein